MENMAEGMTNHGRFLQLFHLFRGGCLVQLLTQNNFRGTKYMNIVEVSTEMGILTEKHLLDSSYIHDYDKSGCMRVKTYKR